MKLLARSSDYFAELVTRAVAEGVDIVFLADDFAYNKGLFVQPQRFASLCARISSGSSSRPAVPASRLSSTPTARSTKPWKCSWRWALPASIPWILQASTTASTSAVTAGG